MRTDRSSVVIILAALAASACQGQVTPPDSSDRPAQLPVNAVAIQFETINELTSPFGGPAQSERRVIRTESDWLALWNSLSVVVPPDDPPAIDFSQDMVIVTAMGQRSSGGHQISVEGVYEEAGELYVDVLEVSPTAACFVTAVITTPIAAVRVPRRDGDVNFMERSESRC